MERSSIELINKSFMPAGVQVLSQKILNPGIRI